MPWSRRGEAMIFDHNGWTDYTVGLLALAILGISAVSFGGVLLIDWIKRKWEGK
jgi:hypothetical protein